MRRDDVASTLIRHHFGTTFPLGWRGHGAPVAQWVKRWPTDLAGPSSIPARGEIFSTVNGVQLHTAFHYQPSIVLI